HEVAGLGGLKLQSHRLAAIGREADCHPMTCRDEVPLSLRLQSQRSGQGIDHRIPACRQQMGEAATWRAMAIEQGKGLG
ncbi:hypothetical protein, partial [Aeromonas hydrophila]|uniref:hypothetical protein n=1 Tax=Aeromonas hydrophila TaxID=644 RepID=UPI0036DDE968